MYHDYYGLKQAPFKITPDTRLSFPGGSRGEILEALVYAISSGEGITKVVGEVGSGKTMLCRMLDVRLAKAAIDIVYLPNPSLTPEDILHAIALELQLKLDPSVNRIHAMQALHQFLLEKHADNKRVVVFVEEAQSMPLETLEEIRLLSNLETQQDKLLQIVLFGQPELDRNLNARNIRQLRERITHSFDLPPLTPDDIQQYVRFRLHAVGYRGPDVFDAATYKVIADASQGLTRRVNILADKCMLAAFADNTHNVSRKHAEKAIANSTLRARKNYRKPTIAIAALLILALVGVGFSLLPLTRFQAAAAYLISGEPPATDVALVPVPSVEVARTRRIGELLVGKGVVSEDQVRIALTEQKNSQGKEHLGKILVRLGFATEAVIRDVLGGALGYDSVDLSKVVVDHDVVKLIPKEIARRFSLIAVTLDRAQKLS